MMLQALVPTYRKAYRLLRYLGRVIVHINVKASRNYIV